MKADYPGILPEDVANNIIVPWFDMDALERVWEETKRRYCRAYSPAVRPR